MHRNEPAAKPRQAPSHHAPDPSAMSRPSQTNQAPSGHISENARLTTWQEVSDQPSACMIDVTERASSGLCRTIAKNTPKPHSRCPGAWASAATTEASATPSIKVWTLSPNMIASQRNSRRLDEVDLTRIGCPSSGPAVETVVSADFPTECRQESSTCWTT